MEILVNWIVKAMIVFAISYIIPGVHLLSFQIALIVALLLGIFNAFLKPILIILTLPITLLTFGLFTFVLNALLILVVDKIVPGFTIDSFLTAFIFGLILSLVNTFIFKIFPK